MADSLHHTAPQVSCMPQLPLLYLGYPDHLQLYHICHSVFMALSGVFFSSYLLEILAASLISLPVYMCAMSSFYFCVVDRRLSGSGLVGTWKFQTSSLFLHIVILLLFHTLCTRTVDFRVGLESHSSCKNRTQKSTWTHLL